jgi:hypothetical protein
MKEPKPGRTRARASFLTSEKEGTTRMDLQSGNPDSSSFGRRTREDEERRGCSEMKGKRIWIEVEERVEHAARALDEHGCAQT